MSWKSDIAPSSAISVFGISSSPSQLGPGKPTVRRGNGTPKRTRDDLTTMRAAFPSFELMRNGATGGSRSHDRFIEHGRAAPCNWARRPRCCCSRPGRRLAVFGSETTQSPRGDGLRSIATHRGFHRSTMRGSNDFQNAVLGQAGASDLLRNLVCRPESVGQSCRVDLKRVGDRVFGGAERSPRLNAQHVRQTRNRFSAN